jgi:hypothetical protein
MAIIANWRWVRFFFSSGPADIRISRRKACTGVGTSAKESSDVVPGRSGMPGGTGIGRRERAGSRLLRLTCRQWDFVLSRCLVKPAADEGRLEVAGARFVLSLL